MARSPLHHTDDLTVIDAIKALESVCDGATTKDGQGFNKFDRGQYESIIEKALATGLIDQKEERTAHNFLKKYKKQLKELGIDFHQIGMIPRAPEDDETKRVNDRIPEWIAEHHFKTVDDTKRVYYYVDGVYSDKGETLLEAIIEKEFPKVTSNKMIQDTIGKVKRRTYIDRDELNSKPIVNVKNGLLDLETMQLGPHTPDYISTAQLNVVYDPNAIATAIRKFLGEVAQPQDIALIEELIGWLLWPDYNVHKALMLLGPGRNGKGTLLRLITAFLGKRSISNVTLQELTSDRFAKADLYGKIANIGGDLPSKDLFDTAAFRNLTGGDDNRAQEKYRAAFNFRNKAKLLFSANVLPRSEDDTYAFYSRWVIIEFLHRYLLEDGTADPNLDEKLQTPEEMSGLLNMALEGLTRLRGNGWRFSYTKTVHDVEVMYKRNSNPVLAFLMDECEIFDSGVIEKSVLNKLFNKYAREHNITPLSTTKFTTLLKDQTEIPVSDYRPFVQGGSAPRCWLGIAVKRRVHKKPTPKPQLETQSIPSILTATPSLPERKKLSINVEGKGKVGNGKSMDGMDCPLKRNEKHNFPRWVAPRYYSRAMFAKLSPKDRIWQADRRCIEAQLTGEAAPDRYLMDAYGGEDDYARQYDSKRTCAICGYKSPHELGTWFYDGVSHYACTTCRMGPVPSKPKEPEVDKGQTTLGEAGT